MELNSFTLNQKSRSYDEDYYIKYLENLTKDMSIEELKDFLNRMNLQGTLAKYKDTDYNIIKRLKEHYLEYLI